MKNFKKVLALVLAFTMVFSTLTTVFAQEATKNDAKAEVLHELGLLHGISDTEFDPNLAGKADRAAALKVLGDVFGWDVDKDLTAADPYKDAAKVGIYDYAWAAPYVQYASDNGVSNGVTATEFGVKNPVTDKHVITWITRELGFGDAWNNISVAVEAKVISFEEALAITVGETELNRDALVGYLYNALTLENVDGVTPIELLVADGKVTAEAAEAAGLYTPVVEELTADVTATNLKTFVVEFNQPVVKDSIKVEADVKLAQTIVSDDLTTVVGVYETTLGQSKNVEFKITAKTESGKELKEYKVKQLVNDTVVPTLESATALNPKQIELQFSEPVQLNHRLFTLLKDIKIDEKSVVAKAEVNYSDNTVILELSTALVEGTHTLEVANVKDFANFTAPTTSFDLTVVKDETAPVALSAEVKSKDEVIVTFDEPVTTLGSFKVDGVSVTSLDHVDNTGKRQVSLKGLELKIGAVVEVKVEYKGQKDIMGNEVKEWKTVLTRVEDDATLPTATLTSVKNENGFTQLEITFSKSMLVAGKYTLLNKDGKEVEFNKNINIVANDFKKDSKNTVLLIKVLENSDPADYKIKLEELRDLTVRGNALPTVTFDFKSIDTKAPEALSAYKWKDVDGDAKEKVTIYFSEAMDVATIENPANYLVDKTGTGTGTFLPITHEGSKIKSVKAADDAKSVTIEYDGARITYIFRVIAVKDVAGNTLVFVNNEDANISHADSQTISILSATATDRHTVKVEFSASVANADPAAFVLRADGEDKIGFSEAKILSGGSVVEFKSVSALNTDAGYLLRVASKDLIKNIYGESLNHDVNDTHRLHDAIAPEFDKVEKTGDNKFKVFFTEAVEVTSVAQDILIKKGNEVLGFANDEDLGDLVETGGIVTVTKAGVDSTYAKEFTFTFADDVELRDRNGEVTLKVSLPLGINTKDVAGNRIQPVGDKEVVINYVAAEAPVVVPPVIAYVDYVTPVVTLEDGTVAEVQADLDDELAAITTVTVNITVDGTPATTTAPITWDPVTVAEGTADIVVTGTFVYAGTSRTVTVTIEGVTVTN